MQGLNKPIVLVTALLICFCSAAFHSSSYDYRSRAAMRQQPLHLNSQLTANATADLHESLFRKVLTVIVPDIVALIRNVTIPGQVSAHFSFSSFNFSTFNIQNVTITFASPDVVIVNLQGLALTVPKTNFAIYDTVLGLELKCSGQFWAALASTNLQLEMHMSTNSKGKLTFSSGNATASFGDLNINHQFNQEICTIAQNIIEVFIGSIDALLRRLIEKDLPQAIAPLIEDALNNAFDKLPFVAVGNPVVTSDGVTAVVDLIATIKEATNSSVSRRLPKRWKKAYDINRDIILTLPQQSVTNLLIFEEQQHHLQGNVSIPPSFINTSSIAIIIPQAQAACNSCPIKLDITTTQAPSVQFGSDTVTAAITMLNIALSAIDNINKTVPLFDLNINASLGIVDLKIVGDSNNVIWFQLQLNTFSFAVGKSEIGPLDIDSLSTIVEILLKSVVIPDFNNKFKGISLPKEIDDVVLTVQAANAILALDINLQ